MIVVPLFVDDGGVLVGIGLVAMLVSIALGTIEIVPRDRETALFVHGEFQGVLEPGVTVVPPFVSRTKPVPSTTETVDVPLNDVDPAGGERPTETVRADLRVVDAEAAFTAVDDYRSAFEEAVRSATREELQRRSTNGARQDARSHEKQIRDAVGSTVSDWGLVVPAVELDGRSRVTSADD